MESLQLSPSRLEGLQTPMMSRLNRTASGREDAACDAALFEEVVHIFQFEAAGLGKEEVHHGDLKG